MEVVHFNAEQLQWMPVLAATKIYTGALVSQTVLTPLEGVMPMTPAVGDSNTGVNDYPYGVVVGNNNVSGNIEADSSGEYITQVAAGATYGATKNYQPIEGEYPYGDRMAYVQVHRITPTTVLRANLWDTTLGTDLAEVAITANSGGDGIGCTTAAATVANVARFGTIYVRTGANRGVYRKLTSASTAAQTWLHAMPAEFTVGDKVIICNQRHYGITHIQTDATGVFIDANDAGTNFFPVDVRRLDLSTAGNQYMEFTFLAENFCPYRA